jgi:hypothetical protein
VVGEHAAGRSARLRGGRPADLLDRPLVMARRLGRREVVERIFNYLNLDETSSNN